MTSARPNLTLSAASHTDLLAQLRAIDISIPLHVQGKIRKHYCERFMMARLLSTMATAGRLKYPLEVVHGDKPDFTITQCELETGIECVEAVPDDHRHIEDIRQQHYPGALNFGQRFTPGMPNFTKTEKKEIASGERAGPPWMSGSMKRNWIAAMKYVIGEKTAKLRKGNYASTRTNSLLVQDEWPNPLHFYPEQVRFAAGELLVQIAPLLSQPAFVTVFISSGDQLLCLQKDQLVVEKICNMWQ